MNRYRIKIEKPETGEVGDAAGEREADEQGLAGQVGLAIAGLVKSHGNGFIELRLTYELQTITITNLTVVASA